MSDVENVENIDSDGEKGDHRSIVRIPPSVHPSCPNLSVCASAAAQNSEGENQTASVVIVAEGDMAARRPKKKLKQEKRRCAMERCRKHRTLMTCACGEQFCITHFSPATHRCKHVSKHGDRQALADSMVSAAFEKLERL